MGKPPDGMFCTFRHLRNVVVMPSRGRFGGTYKAITRSLCGKVTDPWPHASVGEILMGQLMRISSVDDRF